MPSKKPPQKASKIQKTVVAKTPTKAMPKARAAVSPKKPVVAVKKKESRSLLVGIQFAIAGSAIAVLILIAAIERNVFATRSTDAAGVPATIGLEHSSPLSLSVLFARKGDAGYVSIKNNSTEEIHLSLPSNWSRTEVTGTDIKNVTQDIPVFGFSRYKLPGGAGMKLLVSEAPSAVFFDSTSSSVTAVDLKTIDLVSSETNGRVILVQKQSLIPLWGQADAR